MQGPERVAFPEQGVAQADTSVAEMVDAVQQGTHGGFHVRAVHSRSRRSFGARAWGKGLHVDGLRPGVMW